MPPVNSIEKPKNALDASDMVIFLLWSRSEKVGIVRDVQRRDQVEVSLLGEVGPGSRRTPHEVIIR